MIDARDGMPNWRGLSVLVVSPAATHPQDHGNRKRIFEICSELKRQGAEIHFIYYAAEQDWRERRPIHWEREMAAAWDSFHLVVPSRALHEVARGDDHLIDEWQDPALAGCVRWFCAMRKYDAVIVNYTWLSFCFDHLPHDIFKILDTHDVFSGRRAMLENNGLAVEFFHTTRAEEAKAVARADLVWAIKPSEREFFENELGAENCLTMLHAEPEKGWWSGVPSNDGWLRAGIIGARNNVNRRNLEMFLAAALPIFENYIAPVKIVIAGGCAEDFSSIDEPNIEIMGRVADVADFYRDMDVIVAPMQFSTGLKIKVSEAFASGAPLLAHVHATEGYPVTDPMHRLASFEAIARELAMLSFDRSRLPALAVASHAVSVEIQRDVLCAIEQTRRHTIDSMKPATCIVAPLRALNKELLLFDQFFAAIDDMRAAGPVVIYLTGEAGKFDPDLLCSLGAEPPIFVAPSLARQLGEALPESWMSLEFVDLLRSREIDCAYFLSSVPSLAPRDCVSLKRAYVHRKAIESSGGVFLPLVGALKSSADVTVLSASDSTSLKAIEIMSDIRRNVDARNRPLANFVQRRKRERTSARIVILGGETDLLVPPLRDLARRMGFSIVVFDPAKPHAMGKLASPQKQAVAGAIDIADARLVVDLAQGHWLADAIVKGAVRSGIPVIKCPRGVVGVIRHNETGDARSVTVGGFLRSVARALSEDAFRGQFRRKASDETASWAQNESGRAGRAGQSAAAELLFQ